MTSHFWLSGHYINLDDVAAVKQTIYGARVFLRSGQALRVWGKNDAYAVVAGLKQRHEHGGVA